MAQLGEQLAKAPGLVLRSGRMVIKALTPKKKGGRPTSGSPSAPPSQGQASEADELTSGFPNAPLSPGQANFGASGRQTSGSPIAPPSPGQANFGASGQTSGLPSVSPARVLQQLRAALARVGRNGLTPEESVEPSLLTFQDVTPVRPRRPEPARPSDVDSQADATGMEQILKELHRMIASQERMLAEVKAEVQQVRTEVTSEAQRVRAEVTAEMQQVRAEVTAELQQVRAEVQVWRAELEKTVRTVELNEAQLRTQILGTAAGLVRVEQTLQQEVAQLCAKLAMMQNEQEKKKGNEEERLNELMRERIEEFAQQLEETEVTRLQEHQQSLEEWLAERMCREFDRQKRSQTEFNKKMAELVDKLKQESETKVTIVLELCEQVAERLRMYESQLKIAEQQLGPELDKGQREPGEPLNFNFEAEKLADNDQAADKTTSMLAHSQREPGEPLNFNFGEVTGGVSANAGSSSVATGSLSPAGCLRSDAPEELRYEAEKLADNDAMATSWRARYQKEKIEVAAEAQEEHTLDAAEAQKEPALDLSQSEENEARADAHMVGGRRSTLLYGNSDENEMIEGRPVYERTKVSEVLADASGGSDTEGGDAGERLHLNVGAVVVADDMQSKPFSGFSAEFEKEVSSSAGKVSFPFADDGFVDRVSAAVEAARAALRAGLEESGLFECNRRPVN